jgi:hypothetical protein
MHPYVRLTLRAELSRLQEKDRRLTSEIERDQQRTARNRMDLVSVRAQWQAIDAALQTDQEQIDEPLRPPEDGASH